LENLYFAGLTILSGAADMPAGTILPLDASLIVQVGIHALNIAVLMFVMIRLLYKPVKNFMAQRTQRIQNDMDSASAANEKANLLKQQYEDLVKNIDVEREKILAQAQAQALSKSDEILLGARQEANYLLQKAEDKIITERKTAAAENKRLIIDLSTKMAAHFVSVSIDEQSSDKFLDEALTDWSEKTWRA
jgi:F-type H+-transporting ATPase subunit b